MSADTPPGVSRVGPGFTVDDLRARERTVVYKHSPVCGSSALAIRQIARFAEAHPDIPIYLVDVIAQRDLSQTLAHQLGIGHESPQVIVLRRGEPCWEGSHFEVTAERLEQQVERC